MSASRKAIDKRLAAAGWSLERKPVANTGYLLHGPDGQTLWAYRLVDVEATMDRLGL